MSSSPAPALRAPHSRRALTAARRCRDGTRVIEFTNGLRETVKPDGSKTRETLPARDGASKPGAKAGLKMS